MRLKNKVAIVTGAGSGLGKAIANKFLEEGAKVMFADVQGSKEELISGEQKDEADFSKCDVSKSAQIKKIIEKTLKKWGRVDVMVNNAGIGSMGGVLEETDENWQKVIKVNLNGVFYGTREAAGVMSDKKIKGSIINMSSILGSVGLSGTISYCSSKGGVEQVTRTAALDLAKSKIRVNAIAPGFIKTNMTEEPLKDSNFSKMIKSNTPMGHVGEVDDIASAAVFLASDESKYVTGEVLHVDGGWSAR